MKKITLLAFLAPTFLFAQDDSTETNQKKFIKVISISVYGGGDFYREGFEDRTVFQQAAPTSTLAYADLSGYTTWSGFAFQYGGANTSNGINVNLKFRSMPAFSELRIGLNHSVTSYAYQSYSQESSTFIGTTTLPGGEILSTDSVSRAYYSYSWDSDIMQLNLAWLVRSNPRRWLNTYTGFGIMAGIGYNGTLEYDHSHVSEYQHTSGIGNMHYTTNREIITQVSERYRAPMFGTYTLYIPIGFNLRLAKHNNFLSHVAIFAEYNGAFQILVPKGVDPKLRTSSCASGGVRWYVHAPGGKGFHQGGKRRHRDQYQRGDGMHH